MTDSKRRTVPGWVWAAAAVLLAFSFYTSWHTRRIRIELAEKQATIDQLDARSRQLLLELKRMRQIKTVLTDPATREVLLHPSRGPSSGLPVMQVLWNPASGVVLVGERVPAPSAGRMYQLWIVSSKNGPFSAAVFQPAPDSTVLEAPLLETGPDSGLLHALRSANALLITEEPAGGSPSPTGNPIWTGRIH